MTNIYLITGFLGAGKTTFLKHQLENSTLKTAVLMNEFGKISMDSVTVINSHTELLELKNGSIFCACLKDKFIDGLAALIRREPDELFIESSGLSDPADMGKVMAVLGKLLKGYKYSYKGSICIIDGLYFFEELDKLVSIERQIKHSHFALISKMDLIDPEAVVKIRKTLAKINKDMQVEVMTKGQHLIRDFNFFPIKDEITTNQEDQKPKTVVLKFTQGLTLNELEYFLESVKLFYYRIKGFVCLSDLGLVKVDTVMDQVEIKIYQESVSDDCLNQLVCLTSKGIQSVSHLARQAMKMLEGKCELIS